MHGSNLKCESSQPVVSFQKTQGTDTDRQTGTQIHTQTHMHNDNHPKQTLNSSAAASTTLPIMSSGPLANTADDDDSSRTAACTGNGESEREVERERECVCVCVCACVCVRVHQCVFH